MNSNKSNKKTIIIIAVVVVIAIIIAIVLWTSLDKGPETKAYSELIEDVRNAKVDGIVFTGSYSVRVHLKDDAEHSLDDFKKKADASSYLAIVPYRINTVERIEELVDTNAANADETADNDYRIYIEENDPSEGSVWSNILPYLSFILIGVLAVFLILSMRGGKGGNSAMTFGKTKARVSSGVKVRFSDVAGAEEEKEELQEIVDFLKNPKKFITLGAKIPKGVLLVGPPGTGKTLFAKAVAGEANVPFFSISGSDFVEMFVGVGASRVRDLFNQAKKNMPCIVFIDEIDAVGRQRGAGLGGGNDEREQTLNQLLVEMDGFGTNDGIIIMAATNRADILDPALMRPGRFDRQIFVNIPDVKGREAIFKVHSRNKPIAASVDFKNLARLTTGFSGADIANLLNEAAILAARANRKEIIMKDLLEGINKVIAGPQKKSRVVTETDRRITAFHEAGHAIVGKVMKYCDNVQEVSVIPRGQAAGYTISVPKTDDSHVTKNHLNDEISMMLGGRAAEEIIIQDISTGASNDIKRATDIARKMVCEWGMSDELPNVFFGGDQEVFIGRDYQTQHNYGDAIATVIDREIKKIIDENYARAIAVLHDYTDVLENMVKLLFERETIYGDEVEMLMERKPLDEINKYIDEKLRKIKESSAARPIDSVIVPEKPKAPAVKAPAVKAPEEKRGETPADTKADEKADKAPEAAEPLHEEPTAAPETTEGVEDVQKEKENNDEE